MAQLRDFYRDVNNSLKGMHKNGFYVSRDYGLCSNLDEWCYKNQVSFKENRRLSAALSDQFRKAGLNPSFPFNNGNAGYYLNTVDMFNPKIKSGKLRLEWIKDHI